MKRKKLNPPIPPSAPAKLRMERDADTLNHMLGESLRARVAVVYEPETALARDPGSLGWLSRGGPTEAWLLEIGRGTLDNRAGSLAVQLVAELRRIQAAITELADEVQARVRR